MMASSDTRSRDGAPDGRDSSSANSGYDGWSKPEARLPQAKVGPGSLKSNVGWGGHCRPTDVTSTQL